MTARRTRTSEREDTGGEVGGPRPSQAAPSGAGAGAEKLALPVLAIWAIHVWTCMTRRQQWKIRYRSRRCWWVEGI